MPQKYKAVLLDIDGTLIDSNEQHTDAWVAVLREFGYDIPAERIRPLIGMGGDNLMRELLSLGKDDPTAKEISKRRGELMKSEYLPTVKPFPQARELLVRLKAGEIKTVVATSSKEDETNILLAILQAKELVDTGATGSDVKNSKPDPDIINVALQKSGMRPEDVVMIGDTKFDIEAAAKADVPVIALRSGGASDSDLQGAIAIYDDPADLLAHFTEGFG